MSKTALLFSAAITLLGSLPANAAPSVVTTKGSVLVNHGQGFVTATAGMELQPGDTILVKSDSSASISNGQCDLLIQQATVYRVENTLPCSGTTQQAIVRSMMDASTVRISPTAANASDLTDEQLKASSGAMVKTSNDISSSINKSLAAARSSKDVIKVSCVNEKLTSAKSLQRIMDTSNSGLANAIASGDRELATHEFTKISMANERMRALETEVSQCSGESVGQTEEQFVQTDIDAPPTVDAPPTDVPTDIPDLITGSTDTQSLPVPKQTIPATTGNNALPIVAGVVVAGGVAAAVVVLSQENDKPASASAN